LKKFGIMDVLTGLMTAQGQAQSAPSAGKDPFPAPPPRREQPLPPRKSPSSGDTGDAAGAYFRYVQRHNYLSKKIEGDIKRRAEEEQKSAEELRRRRGNLELERERLLAEEGRLLAELERLTKLSEQVRYAAALASPPVAPPETMPPHASPEEVLPAAPAAPTQAIPLAAPAAPTSQSAAAKPGTDARPEPRTQTMPPHAFPEEVLPAALDTPTSQSAAKPGTDAHPESRAQAMPPTASPEEVLPAAPSVPDLPYSDFGD